MPDDRALFTMTISKKYSYQNNYVLNLPHKFQWFPWAVKVNNDKHQIILQNKQKGTRDNVNTGTAQCDSALWSSKASVKNGTALTISATYSRTPQYL